jgi:hypothetical protein
VKSHTHQLLVSPKEIPHIQNKAKSCYFYFETENGNIKRLKKGENYVKIGFCRVSLMLLADSCNKHIAFPMLAR